MYGSGVSGGGGGGGGGAPSPRRTGWANYRDTQYTSGNPLVIAGLTRTQLPNNAGIQDESQLPEDTISFYDEVGGRILGYNGSDFIVSVRLRLKTTDINSTWVKLEMEIMQGVVPVIIETSAITLSWGVNVESGLDFTFSGYIREAFAASGARLFITADGPIEVYGISYVVKRTHKGV